MVCVEVSEMAYKPKHLKRVSPYKKIVKFFDKENTVKQVIVIGGSLVAITLCAGIAATQSFANPEPIPVVIETQLDLKDYESWARVSLDELEENAQLEISYRESIVAQQRLTSAGDLEVKQLEPIEVELPQEETEEEKYIKLYTDIYGIDYQKVYNKLAEMTNDFTDENYLNQFIIGESKLKGLDVQCESKEMALLIAIRGMYMLPENYGFQSGELMTGLEYESELDNTHQIAYVSRVLGIDPALNYAICRAECGFNSEMFLTMNNPSGIRFDGEWARFPSRTAGFIEQACELLKYKIKGIDTIEGIGAKHAPTIDPANANWVSNVTMIYAEALERYDELFGSEDEVLKLH